MKKALITIIIIGLVLLVTGKIIMIKTENNTNSISINTDVLSSNKSEASGDSNIITKEFENVENINLALGLYSILIQEDSSVKNVQVVAKKPVIMVNGVDIDKLEIDCKNGALTIIQRQDNNKFSTNMFNFDKCKGELLIKIPVKNKLNRVDIENGVGKIEINNLVIDTLDIDSGTSSVSGNNLQMSNCDISGGTGSVKLKDIIAGKIKIDSGTGGTYISGDILEEAKISIGTNSVELELVGNEKDYDYHIETGLGGIKINNSKYKTEVNIDNNADRKIIIDTGTGSVAVKTK